MTIEQVDGDLMQNLIDWMAVRERDIADGVEDFDELREIFFSLFGRNAGEEPSENQSPW